MNENCRSGHIFCGLETTEWDIYANIGQKLTAVWSSDGHVKSMEEDHF